MVHVRCNSVEDFVRIVVPELHAGKKLFVPIVMQFLTMMIWLLLTRQENAHIATL